MAVLVVAACGGRTEEASPAAPANSIVGVGGASMELSAGGSYSNGTGGAEQAGDGGSFDMGGKVSTRSDTTHVAIIDAGTPICADASIDDGGASAYTAGDGGALTCGNGCLDPGEECDDGTNDGRYGGCRPDCTLASRCGDGILDCPEECDLGADNAPVDDPPYGSCLSTCKLGPHCGDGIVQPPIEECDLADLNGRDSYFCNAVCRIPWPPPGGDH